MKMWNITYALFIGLFALFTTTKTEAFSFVPSSTTNIILNNNHHHNTNIQSRIRYRTSIKINKRRSNIKINKRRSNNNNLMMKSPNSPPPYPVRITVMG
jgi:hypothetical protein